MTTPAVLEVIHDMRAAAAGARRQGSARGRALAEKIESWANRLEQGAPDRMSDTVRDFIEGMEVSVDVSTGEHDADRRYFGTVSEVMDDTNGKHGVILLVQNPEPNFKSDQPKADSLTEKKTTQLIADGYKLCGYVVADATGKRAIVDTGAVRWLADMEARNKLMHPGPSSPSPFLQGVHHAYAQTDGSYKWPNSREGDLLRQAMKELIQAQAREAA